MRFIVVFLFFFFFFYADVAELTAFRTFEQFERINCDFVWAFTINDLGNFILVFVYAFIAKF